VRASLLSSSCTVGRAIARSSPRRPSISRGGIGLCPLTCAGHGESDKPHGAYPVAAYADDLAYIIEQLGLGKAVAVGHSMGGKAVLQLAVAYPDRVAAIVMVDPAPFVSTPELHAAMESMAADIEAGNQESRRRFITSRMFLPTSDRRLVENVTAVMLAAPSHVAASAIRGAAEFDGPAVAALCKVPALHLAGARPLNPPHLMSEWLDRWRRSFQPAGGPRPSERDDRGLPAALRVTLPTRMRRALAVEARPDAGVQMLCRFPWR
jgi:pimeloyl-ACP methyl ester carboxylesterase